MYVRTYVHHHCLVRTYVSVNVSPFVSVNVSVNVSSYVNVTYVRNVSSPSCYVLEKSRDWN